MNDTDIQDVTYIDQPAELEGIWLNWGRSQFVKTNKGPRDVRTAPTTPAFWEIWNRNKEALKTAGITCTPHTRGDWWVVWWIDVSGDVTDVTPADDIHIPDYILSSDYVTPVDDIDVLEDESGDVTPTKKIHIPEGESYTLSEVIDLVKQTLDGVSEKSGQNTFQYSSTDVYWLLHDMLGYVSRNVSGVYVLRQTEKNTYRVKHMAEDFAKQRSGRKLKAEINRTASYLAKLTGRKPSWGDKE